MTKLLSVANNPQAAHPEPQHHILYHRPWQFVPRTLEEPESYLPDGPTETTQLVRARRVQTFFRATVLVSYENQCALSDVTVPDLLIASHIIPWKDNEKRRADPTNGLALNALYDRAFDRGLITFDEKFKVVLSARLVAREISSFHEEVFSKLRGHTLRLPRRFSPDPEAMRYHREKIFR